MRKLLILVLFLLCLAPVAADYEAGVRAYEDELYEIAYMFFKEAADNENHAEAMFYLGEMYLYGNGVDKDLNTAVGWYRKASSYGSGRARAKLDRMGWRDSKPSKSDPKQLQAAAEGGDKEAQFRLGQLYEAGKGVARDESQAARWYGKASDQGHAGAMFHLGQLYESGRGVSTDPSQALKLYRKAAKKKNKKAKSRLALLTGKTVEEGPSTDVELQPGWPHDPTDEEIRKAWRVNRNWKLVETRRGFTRTGARGVLYILRQLNGRYLAGHLQYTGGEFKVEFYTEFGSTLTKEDLIKGMETHAGWTWTQPSEPETVTSGPSNKTSGQSAKAPGPSSKTSGGQKTTFNPDFKFETPPMGQSKKLGDVPGPDNVTEALVGTLGPAALAALLQMMAGAGGGGGGGFVPPPTPGGTGPGGGAVPPPTGGGAGSGTPIPATPGPEPPHSNLENLRDELKYRQGELNRWKAKLDSADGGERAFAQRQLALHKDAASRVTDEINAAERGHYERTVTDLDKQQRVAGAQKRANVALEAARRMENIRDQKARVQAMRKAIDKMPPAKAFEHHLKAHELLYTDKSTDKAVVAKKIHRTIIQERITEAKEDKLTADAKAARADFLLSAAEKTRTAATAGVVILGMAPLAPLLTASVPAALTGLVAQSGTVAGTALAYNILGAGIDAYAQGGARRAFLAMGKTAYSYTPPGALWNTVSTVEDGARSLSKGDYLDATKAMASLTVELGLTYLSRGGFTIKPGSKAITNLKPSSKPRAKTTTATNPRSPGKHAKLEAQRAKSQIAAGKKIDQFKKSVAEHQRLKKEYSTAVKARTRAQEEVSRIRRQLKRAQVQGKGTQNFEQRLKKATAVRDSARNKVPSKTPLNKAELKVQKEALALNNDYQAKVKMKYDEKAIGRKFDERIQKSYRDIDRDFGQEMKKRGWSDQQITEFRNKKSLGTTNMDRDVGLREPSILEPKTRVVDGNTRVIKDKHGNPVLKYKGPKDPEYLKDQLQFRKALTRNGQRESVAKWNHTAEEVYEKVYNRHFEKKTGTKLGPNVNPAKTSLQELTSSQSKAAVYKDMNAIHGKPDEIPFQKEWSSQTADVTRQKGMELTPGRSPLSDADSLQEILRGSAKDLDKVLNVLRAKAELGANVDMKSVARILKVREILRASGRGQMNFDQAEKLLGSDLWDVHNLVGDFMEGALKFGN